ncbi:TerB family tellurite resistance protein [Marinobacter sp. VGCF2001]|uniref:TerB family tellurite resistance protein n=1 Tax=Marinobacter sp. VGCF2001 TaxID=3417189 RepID=UPI003CF18250
MFINNLTRSQQAIFLGLAEDLIAVDGKIDERETNILRTLTTLCDGDASAVKNGSDAELVEEFSDRKSRVSLLLELIGIAYADEAYDEREKGFINRLATALGVPGVLVEDLESWVHRQMILNQEAQIFMEE